MLRPPFSTEDRRCQRIEKKHTNDIPNDTTEANFDDCDDETNKTDDKISL